MKPMRKDVQRDVVQFLEEARDKTCAEMRRLQWDLKKMNERMRTLKATLAEVQRMVSKAKGF
jgi:hypothetical protein